MRKLLTAGLLIPVLAACGASITEHTDAFGNTWKINCSNRKYIIESVVGEDIHWGAPPMRTVQERVKAMKEAGEPDFAIGFGAAYSSNMISEACGANK